MTGTGSKYDILWSPTHEDRFLTFTNDLSLYRLESTKDGQATKPQTIRLSEEYIGNLMATNSDHSYIKCLAWYPKSPPENLLAVGLATGKVMLSSFGKSTSDPLSLVGRELSPKHHRQCQYLSWNPVETNLLAEGLEKHRGDHSIQIWDVCAKCEGSVPVKPAFELGHAEPTSSLAWFRMQPKSLVTGMNNKFLRIYDLRDISRPRSVAYTKAVHGIKVDPKNDCRFASYTESQVLIWDTRMFDKPALTLHESKQCYIGQLAWSPTRSNLLACLAKESSVIKLYDIHGGSEDLEPSVVERIIQPYKQDTVAAFDWHPTQENRLLTISSSASVKDVKVFEKISVCWSPDIYLSWGCGRELLQYHSVQSCREASEDISLKMKRRTLKGYGIQSDIAKNGNLTDDPQLRNLWSWLSYAKAKLAEEQQSKGLRTIPKVQGIKSILKFESTLQSPAQSPPAQNGGLSRSDVDYLSWQLTDDHRLRSQRKIYRSEERNRALVMCGWGHEHNASTSVYIERVENEEDYERAAAISVFTLRMSKAISVLNNGAKHRASLDIQDLNLNVVAMALSGYYDDKNTLWAEMCRSLKEQLTNGYLRAMFSFLTCEEDNYSDILNEEELAVADRVAFACVYLPDVKLQEFVCDLCSKLISKGSLDGILLTGFTLEGVDLLQTFIDLSGDIQTAALTSVQALPNQELSKDGRVLLWIEEYRALLDVWRLWHQRAEFDVYKNEIDNTSRIQPQVCACCNFCGKSISFNATANRNRAFMFPSSGSMRSRTVYSSAPMHNTAKVTSCPGCRKPLPRCALCLINMGTAAGNQRHKPNKSITEDSEKLSSFSDWFTWCQTCRHGGHADHMKLWFKDNTDCPVTGCSCKCTELDSVASIMSEESIHS